MFKNKTLLITGGTGSFGNAVLKRFLETDIREIRVFSRDEKKQDDMRKKYNDAKLKFYIGDVRDYDSILNASRGVDYIYHSENQYFRYGKCLRSRHPKPDKTRRLS